MSSSCNFESPSLVKARIQKWVNLSLSFHFQINNSPIESLSLVEDQKQINRCLFLLQINNSPIESLSLVEARKLLEKSKDKLQLIITKKKFEESPHKRQNSLPKDDGKYRLTNSSSHPDITEKLLTGTLRIKSNK